MIGRTLRIAPALLLLAAGVLGTAWAQDGAANWHLDFSHDPLNVVTVHYKDGSARSFYYMTFRVKNSGSTDAPLSLQFKATVGSHPLKRKVHYALPHLDAEETVRRIGRASQLKNVQQINRNDAKDKEPRGALGAGQSLQGIAVFGTFDREWDVAGITVSGLEPRVISTRVVKYGADFTVPHRAHSKRNAAVLKKAGDTEGKAEQVILFHDAVWSMTYRRKGDEFAPHQDPILLEGEGWKVQTDPAPKILTTKGPLFKE